MTNRAAIVSIAIALAGCTPLNDADRGFRDGTVNELFETWSQAKAERDWDTWFRCMTPDARKGEAASLLFVCPVLIDGAKSKLASASGDDATELDAWIREGELLLRSAEGNETFALEMMKHIDSPANPQRPKPDASTRSIEIVEEAQGSAEAKVYKDGRFTGRIWFKRIDGRWRIDTTFGAT